MACGRTSAAPVSCPYISRGDKPALWLRCHTERRVETKNTNEQNWERHYEQIEDMLVDGREDRRRDGNTVQKQADMPSVRHEHEDAERCVRNVQDML